MVAFMLFTANSEQDSKRNDSALAISNRKLLSYGNEAYYDDVNPLGPSQNVEKGILVSNMCSFHIAGMQFFKFSSSFADDVFAGAQGQGSGNCQKQDIAISQSHIQRGGIPIYSVEITNQCRTRCFISNIHLYCGSFGSATVINPRVFRRLKINDCIVNDGKPLKFGSTISFTYQTTFQSNLSVASVVC